MLLGISSYAYGWAVGVPGHPPPAPYDEHDLLATARRHHLRVVQYGDHIPLREFPSHRLDRLRDAATAAGIAIEIGARGLTARHLERLIDTARKLHSPLLRFVIDGPGHEPARADLIALLREALPALNAANLVLGIENHDRFPARVLRDLIDAVASPRVGICLDTANSLGAGEGIEHVLTHLAAVTVNLHLKDIAITRVPHAMGFTIEGRPAGRGQLDLRAVLETVAERAGPRCPHAILETWTPPETTLDATLAKERRWAEESLLHLKSLFPSP